MKTAHSTNYGFINISDEILPLSHNQLFSTGKQYGNVNTFFRQV